MSISYGWEKLHIAVHTLTGNGEQAERLVDAIVFNLIHIKPSENLPKEMQGEFSEFMNEVKAIEASGDEGNIKATIDQMDEIERSKIIEKIIGFYDHVCRHMEK